jgi:hypothetical protein
MKEIVTQIQVRCNYKYRVSDILKLTTREGVVVKVLVTQDLDEEADVLLYSTDIRQHCS